MLRGSDPIRAAAFDLDGTLIDTAPDLVAAVNLTLCMLGGNELPEPIVKTMVGDGVDKLVGRALTRSLGHEPTHGAQISAALTLFRRLYAQALFNRSQVYPGVEQTLRAFSAAGVRLCCLTNKESALALPLLEQAGLAPYFVFTLCADKPEDRKPKPNLLQSACSRLDIAPGDLLYVGDSRIDVMAARAAGCRIVAVSYGYADIEAVREAGPDAIIDTMTDLSVYYARSNTLGNELASCPGVTG